MYIYGMGQMLLPLFPEGTKYMTPNLGVKEADGFIYYLHSGVPIYSHCKTDMSKFRYVTSSIILEGLCKNKDIVEVFHVSPDSVRRWKKKLIEEGEGAFFGQENRQGRSHKLLPDVLKKIQKKLDTGQSVNSIAKEHKISEGSIRYAIKKGRLKKR